MEDNNFEHLYIILEIYPMKYFFGNSKYSSVTSMLLELELPSFSTMFYVAQFKDEFNK